MKKGRHVRALVVVTVVFWTTTALASPPSIRIIPAVTNVALGSSVTLCADVGGIGPFQIQWRHDGQNITEANGTCYQLSGIQLADAGAYTVVVSNSDGVAIGGPAFVLLDFPTIQGSDRLTNRTIITGTSGFFTASNNFAGTEPGEPRLFGKPGGKSVWYAWKPSTNGIATVHTTGSTFDTLLGIYVECSPGNLVEVASDDDQPRSLTSLVRFNVFAGTNYLIAVDGFGGANGPFACSWNLEVTTEFLPVFVDHPKSVTAAPGEAAVFAAEAVPECALGQPSCDLCNHPQATNNAVAYQWYFDGGPISGQTNSTLLVSNVRPSDVGAYRVLATRSGRSVFSRPAMLQLNVTGSENQPARAENKFEDAIERNPIELGGFTLPSPSPPPGRLSFAAASTVVRGYTGTQIFQTSEATTEPNDQPICGVIGGASYWITFVPLETGVLHLNTDGSSYNTVLAVFVRSVSNPAILQLVGCDNNSGLDGRDSALSVPVSAGVTNFVMIDGVNGQTGLLQLNYSLITAATITFLGHNGLGHALLRVNTHTGAHFAIQASANATNWTSVVTTNASGATLDYTDTTAAGQGQRFYRASMLP